MAKKCLCFYFDPLWSSFPTNCQSIWGRKRQFSSSGSWCYQHALGQHGWVTGWPRILWMMKSLVFDFCVLKPYKDPRGFSSLLILLMEKILHQLRLVVYPINCRVSMGFIHPRWVQDFFHQQYDFVNDEIIGVDFAFWNLYKDPTWFLKFTDTVDGKNPAPVEVGSLLHYLQGLIHPRWLFGISEPSTVSSTTKPGFLMETPQKNGHGTLPETNRHRPWK